MKVLVTGGAGFIGTHLTKRLVRENNKVHVLDDFSRAKKENKIEKVNYIVRDVRSNLNDLE